MYAMDDIYFQHECRDTEDQRKGLGNQGFGILARERRLKQSHSEVP